MVIYLCNGINVADLVKLRYSNIFDGEICFIREKTKRTSNTIKHIRAVITPNMQAIINRWGNEAHSQNYIFNLINYTEDPIRHVKEVKDLTKRINKRMKSIGKELGIGTITTYTARHRESSC